jgi:hypothetical protein
MASYIRKFATMECCLKSVETILDGTWRGKYHEIRVGHEIPFDLDWDIIFLEEQKNYNSGTANFSGCSLGFGLKFNKLKFNYSYSRYTLAGNTSLLV